MTNKTYQEFLLGDCIESMKDIPDNSVTSIITDPPYALKMANWDTFNTMKHFQEFCESWAKECFRILKPGGTIAAFNAARTYHHMAVAFDNVGFECRDMVEWVYWTGMPKGKNLKGCHEPIYIGWKPAKAVAEMTFNIDDVRIPVKEKCSKDGSTKVTINNLEMTIKDVDNTQ